MAEISAFFNYRDEDAERYPAEVFAEYFASLIGNGIFNGGDNLRAYCTGADRIVRVLPGSAWINGYYYRLKDEELPLELAEADATLDRIDRIVVRLNTDPGTYAIHLVVLQGTPASEPEAPELVREGDIYDLSIATVRIAHNTAALAADAVTDTRLLTDVCGLVNSLITVDTSQMQQAFDESFDAWDDRVAGYARQWTQWMADCDNQWSAKLAIVQDTLDGKADKSHTHTAADVTAGTLAGRVQANASAVATLANKQLRNIVIATSAPSGASNGDIWLSYTQ